MRCCSSSKSSRGAPGLAPDHHDLAVHHAPAGNCARSLLDDLGKVAGHGLAAAADQFDVVAVPKDNRPEAIPFRLVSHARVGRYLRHARREHRFERAASLAGSRAESAPRSDDRSAPVGSAPSHPPVRMRRQRAPKVANERIGIRGPNFGATSAAEFEQVAHPAAMAPERFEQLPHPDVGRGATSGPAHPRALHRRAPRTPCAGCGSRRPTPRPGRRTRSAPPRLRSRRRRRGSPSTVGSRRPRRCTRRAGPPRLPRGRSCRPAVVPPRTGGMPSTGSPRGQRIGRQQQPGRGPGAGSRLAHDVEVPDGRGVGPVRLRAGDLLLEDRPQQIAGTHRPGRRQASAACWRANSATIGWWAATSAKPLRLVPQPGDRVGPVEQPFGARPVRRLR